MFKWFKKEVENTKSAYEKEMDEKYKRIVYFVSVGDMVEYLGVKMVVIEIKEYVPAIRNKFITIRYEEPPQFTTQYMNKNDDLCTLSCYAEDIKFVKVIGKYNG